MTIGQFQHAHPYCSRCGRRSGGEDLCTRCEAILEAQEREQEDAKLDEPARDKPDPEPRDD